LESSTTLLLFSFSFTAIIDRNNKIVAHFARELPMSLTLTVSKTRHRFPSIAGRVGWAGLLVLLIGPALGHGQGLPDKKLAGPLVPTKVHLKFTDTPVDQAVAELSRKSGYFLFLADEEGKGELKKRTITLDTGEVTFWEAFEKLCAKGGLVEGAAALVPKTMPSLPPPPKPGEPIPLIKFGDGTPLFRSMSGVLTLKDGTRAKDPFGIWRPVPMPSSAPSDTATAVRVQGSKLFISLNRDNAPLAAGQVRSELKVTPEPKVQWQELVGIRIDRAIDEHGQTLQTAKNVVVPKFGGSFGKGAPGTEGGGFSDPLTSQNVAFVPVRLSKGAKASTMLAELKGAISAKVSVFGPELLAVEDVAKAQGKAIKGAKGGAIKVGATKAGDQGDVQFALDLTLPAQFIPPPRGGASNSATPLPGLKVLDADGKAIPILSMVRSNPNRAFGPEFTPGVPAEFLVTVRPGAGQTATKVSYSTRQIVMVEIPFSLNDVVVR
jgi:hypothetical protein